MWEWPGTHWFVRAFICTQYLGTCTLYIPIKYLVNCLFRTTSSFLVCLCVANEHTMRAQRVCSSGWYMEFQSGQTCQPCPTVLSRCNYWSVHLTIDLCIWGWPIIITENFNLHMHLDNTFGQDWQFCPLWNSILAGQRDLPWCQFVTRSRIAPLLAIILCR